VLEADEKEKRVGGNKFHERQRLRVKNEKGTDMEKGKRHVLLTLLLGSRGGEGGVGEKRVWEAPCSAVYARLQ